MHNILLTIVMTLTLHYGLTTVAAIEVPRAHGKSDSLIAGSTNPMPPASGVACFDALVGSGSSDTYQAASTMGVVTIHVAPGSIGLALLICDDQGNLVAFEPELDGAVPVEFVPPYPGTFAIKLVNASPLAQPYSVCLDGDWTPIVLVRD